MKNSRAMQPNSSRTQSERPSSSRQVRPCQATAPVTMSNRMSMANAGCPSGARLRDRGAAHLSPHDGARRAAR